MPDILESSKMLFKERESESPRVPSPWSNARRSSGSRNSSNSSKVGTPPDIASHSILRKTSSTASPNFSPLSRAVQIRNAEAYREKQRGYEDEQGSSPTSTPPSQEDDDDDEGLDSFFALDSDTDAQRLSSSQQSLTPDILTPIDGVGLLSTSVTKLDEIKNRATGRIIPQTKRRKKRVARLAPEPDVLGNLEYKLRILPPTRHRFDKLLTQMQWRVLQGGGECTYEIGVLDDGLCIGICALEMQASISVLSSMARELCASVKIRKAFEMIALDGSSQTEGGELKQMSNEQVLAVLEMQKEQEHCDCGVEMNSTREIVNYLPLLTDYPVTIKTEANKYDDPALGEVIIAIEEDASELLTYEQDDTSSDSENAAEEVSQEFFMEEGQGLTFSLSLDEKATRAGLGFQRKSNALRRPCRYNVKSALAHKTNVKSKEDVIPTNDVIVDSVSIKSEDLTTLLPVEMVKEKDDATNASASGNKCIRMIVEASIIRDPDDEGFIDYGSL